VRANPACAWESVGVRSTSPQRTVATMSRHPPTRSAQVFLVSLAVAAADFALAKWAGWDGRSWPVVLSAAVVTATLIAMWSLVANSLKAARHRAPGAAGTTRPAQPE
jgi:hypothetical protein